MNYKKDILKNKSLIEEILPVYIELYFSKSESSIDFWQNLTSITNCFVFGGFIVDFLKNQNNHRDIDIVVDHFNEESKILLKKYNGLKNSFGGYKVDIDGVKIDIWEIRNTWAIKKMNYLDFDLFSILPSTSFFNSTAIIFSIKNNKLIFKNSFINYIKNNSLEILFEDNPYPELCILKTYQNYKKGANLSNQLKRYILQKFSISINKFENAQLRHFNKIKYSNEELSKWYKEISASINNFEQDIYTDKPIIKLSYKIKKDPSSQLVLF